jgi:spore germination protein YaaH
VPFRAIAEALNVEVGWNEETSTVTAAGDNKVVKLIIGDNQAYINDRKVILDVPPQIVNDRTLIPLRFFTEAFSCVVVWDPLYYKVSVTSPVKKMSELAYYALGDSTTSSWTNLFGKAYPQYSTGNTAYVSSLELGWYSLDSSGSLLTKSRTGWQRPDGWESVVQTASLYKLSTDMVVHVTDGDNTITSLLASDNAVDNAVRAIAAEAALYKGVDLDFEGLGFSQSGTELTVVQQRFTKFVEKLRTVLGTSKTLTLSLHPLNSAYKGYDYKALGAIADKIVIMAYDYGTKPEPEALVTEAIEKALQVVPAGKLILGISVPNETADRILVKIGLAKRYGLGGIALWRLGLIGDSVWKAIGSTIAAQ